MKLVATTAYLATLLRPTVASHASTPTPTPTTQTDLISYKLQDAASELAALFISNGTFVSQLFNHGCWCAKLSNQPGSNLGGNKPVDELDQICKDWARARRCSREAGSACENADFTRPYEIEFSGNYHSCENADSCSSETCQIDYYYIQAINDWNANNVFTLNSSPVCFPFSPSGPINSCQAWPTTTPSIRRDRMSLLFV